MDSFNQDSGMVVTPVVMYNNSMVCQAESNSSREVVVVGGSRGDMGIDRGDITGGTRSPDAQDYPNNPSPTRTATPNLPPSPPVRTPQNYHPTANPNILASSTPPAPKNYSTATNTYAPKAATATMSVTISPVYSSSQASTNFVASSKSNPNFSITSKSTPNIPTSPRTSHSFPSSPRSTPNLPSNSPRTTPSFPTSPRSTPNFPSSPRGTLMYPTSPRDTPTFPGSPRSTPNFPTSPRSTPNFPTSPRSTPNFPSSPNFPTSPRAIPTYPSSPRLAPTFSPSSSSPSIATSSCERHDIPQFPFSSEHQHQQHHHHQQQQHLQEQQHHHHHQQVSHHHQSTETPPYTKDDVTIYTSSPSSTITKVTNATVATGNMNQVCKVCGEPAAGFHFGAFTCEGCKSFFGRTYNNLTSLNECKNNGRCVINKKTRTSCKSCRLRKCLVVGMSKSGSRYGRRSNWFKIHYLMQGNNNNTTTNNNNNNNEPSISVSSSLPGNSDINSGEPIFSLVPTPTSPALISPASEPKTFSPDFKFGSEFPPGLECKRLNSPMTSSSESHHSDSSDVGEKPVFPPYFEHLNPKDLLSICQWPALAPHLSPYPNPLSPHLYPYLPLLLHNRQQYLDSLLQKAQQQNEETETEEEPQSLASVREFPQMSKFFKPTTARPPQELRIPVNPYPGNSPVRGLPPLRPLEPPGVPGYNPGHDLTPRESPNIIPLGATAPQDLPIDLSLKNKSPSLHGSDTEGEKSTSSSHHGELDEDKNEHQGNDEENKEEGRRKVEQEAPLDLSSVRTG